MGSVTKIFWKLGCDFLNSYLPTENKYQIWRSNLLGTSKIWKFCTIILQNRKTPEQAHKNAQVIFFLKYFLILQKFYKKFTEFSDFTMLTKLAWIAWNYIFLPIFKFVSKVLLSQIFTCVECTYSTAKITFSHCATMWMTSLC